MTQAEMKQRQLGSNGPLVSTIALGCMGMSGMYGPADEKESISTIHEAIDFGINLLDTGDFYGMGHNEMLIARALNGRRDKVLLSVKFGAMRDPKGAFIGIDSRPQAVRNFCAYSLRRLRTDHIDIYPASRLDPAVPIEDTLGAVADLVKEGYVRFIGLSEVGSETIRRASAANPISDLQIEYSLASRGIESEILPTVRQLGIGVTAYGVLSRGLLTGSSVGKQDFRAHLPRFTGENYEKNRAVSQRLAEIAAERGLPVPQLAIGWVLSKGADIVPVIGARTRTQLRAALAAVNTPLAAEEITGLENLFSDMPIAGTRYDANQMRMLDSER